MTDQKVPRGAATPPGDQAAATAQMTAEHSRGQATTGSQDHKSPAMPPGFDPWEALVDLEAGLVQVDGRWVCSLGTETFSSVRTNGGLGLLPADRDGAEAVWLAWRARRGYAEPPSSPNVSSLWFTRAAEVINVRPPRPGESSWRAWTWARGPAGLLEPGHVYDDNDPTEAVWNVFASARQVQA